MLIIEIHRTAMRFLAALFLICMSVSGAGPSESRLPHALSSLETALIAEINRVRQDPHAYATFLEDQKKHYRGNVLEFPGTPRIRIVEGAEALDEAVQALRAIPSLPALAIAEGLCRAARDHVEDQSGTGEVGHTGTDLSSPSVRARRYSQAPAYIGENIIYRAHDAAWMVLRFLVDSGVPDRGHRKNLLHQEYRVVGVACGAHTVYDSMCVLDFAREYAERPAPLVTQRTLPLINAN